MESLAQLTDSYETAIRLIDEAHSKDPKTIPSPSSSGSLPYELHYAQKMTRWLASRCPEASPALQLACRAQHFRRFVFASRKADLRDIDCRSLGGKSRGAAIP
jgi:hypothetical protein